MEMKYNSFIEKPFRYNMADKWFILWTRARLSLFSFHFFTSVFPVCLLDWLFLPFPFLMFISSAFNMNSEVNKNT